MERRNVPPGEPAPPSASGGGSTRQDAYPATRVQRRAGGAPNSAGPERAGGRAVLLGEHARDIDVSAAAFRNLAVGGGISGFLTVLCAAALVDSPGGVWLWIWQLVFGVCFVWFITSAKGSLSGRGFLVDQRGICPRTSGEVFGVPWDEVAAVGIGSLRPIENRRLVHPERRRCLELFPADSAFPGRHPELERWRVEESPPMQGLPSVRYRFHLPVLSRLPKRLEQAVQAAAPRVWVGNYRRRPPTPET